MTWHRQSNDNNDDDDDDDGDETCTYVAVVER